MIDPSSINAISGIVATVGVLAGVVFAVFQLRDLVKTRQTDLVIRLFSNWGSERLQKLREQIMTRNTDNYEEYEKEYGWSEVAEVGLFFEGIGVLLHRKLVDIILVDDLFSGSSRSVWEKVKPLAEARRKKLNQSEILEWYEYLYNEMQKREQTLQAIQ